MLSQQFYDTPMNWWIIAIANALGKGSMEVPAGIQIRIPNPIDDVTEVLNNASETR